jgi:hypothetical protein
VWVVGCRSGTLVIVYKGSAVQGGVCLRTTSWCMAAARQILEAVWRIWG